jgi:hypothetical protein
MILHYIKLTSHDPMRAVTRIYKVLPQTTDIVFTRGPDMASIRCVQASEPRKEKSLGLENINC